MWDLEFHSDAVYKMTVSVKGVIGSADNNDACEFMHKSCVCVCVCVCVRMRVRVCVWGDSFATRQSLAKLKESFSLNNLEEQRGSLPKVLKTDTSFEEVLVCMWICASFLCVKQCWGVTN